MGAAFAGFVLIWLAGGVVAGGLGGLVTPRSRPREAALALLALAVAVWLGTFLLLEGPPGRRYPLDAALLAGVAVFGAWLGRRAAVSAQRARRPADGQPDYRRRLDDH